jgi:hypothetical protein
LEFVSAGAVGEHQDSELSYDLDELPDDADDSEKYVQIPDKRELEPPSKKWTLLLSSD